MIERWLNSGGFTMLADIELTATGLHFRFADPKRMLSFEADIGVILKNGHTISTSG